MSESPPIGIAVLVVKNGRVLFGKLGKDWHLPAGRLTPRDKTLEAAAARIAKGCAGLEIGQPEYLTHFSWGREKPPSTFARHSIYFIARWESGDQAVLSRHCSSTFSQWEWFNPNLLPHPLFVSRFFLNPQIMRTIRRFARRK